MGDRNKVFYWLEGPPYTTGLPHVGHSYNRFLKDIILRYKRKRGYFVWDRSGFDMHGLPIEEKVQRELGIKNKKEIKDIEGFIKKCMEFSLGYMEEWLKEFWRLAHWIDLDNPYMPITNEYIEKVWSALKKAYEKGLLYEDEKPVWWCPKCQTTLAKHEIELGYEDPKYSPIKDPAIFVKIRTKEENVYFLIWTTTPWTLTFNLGIMINPEIEYALVEVPKVYVKELEVDWEKREVKRIELEKENEKEYWILAKDLVPALMGKFEITEYKIVKTFLGKELEGKEYIPPFYEELKEILDKIRENNQNAFKVWLADFVTTQEGTGVVHSAPGCGPEDYEVGKKYGVKPFNTTDEEGVIRNLPVFEGLKAKEDDLKFVEKLKEKKLLVWFEFYEHDYPICWRCGTRAIIRTTKQWFINVQRLKEKLLEDLKEVNIIPPETKKMFEDIIRNAPDWVITRQRFWGIPLPIWRCEKCGKIKVVGNVKELGINAKRIYIIEGEKEYALKFLEWFLKNKKVIEKDKISKEDIIKAEDKTVFITRKIDEKVLEELKKEGWFIISSPRIVNYRLIRAYNYNLHVPFIDTVELKCECGGKMKRIPDVLDVWIDSGCASFASFEDTEPLFPIEYITENKDQFRGWFYSLAVWGEIYFGKIPYKNIYVGGYVHDEVGRKMSKSFGNVITPRDVYERYGVDTLRLSQLTAVGPFEDMLFGFRLCEEKYTHLNILWNIHKYLIEQACYYGINPKEIKEEELKFDITDKWMLSRLYSTLKEITEVLEKYELWKVGRRLEELWLDLSRVYIKLNRERLVEGDEIDRKTVLWVIYHTLFNIINALSIICPFMTEKIFLNLKKVFGLEGDSIHLYPWPEIREEFIDKELEKDFELLLELWELGLRLRDRKIRIGLRWPLKRFYIVCKKEELKERIKKFEHVLKVKLNVKEIVYGKPEVETEKEESPNFEVYYDKELTEDLIKEGILRELQRRLQELRKEMGLRKGEKVKFVMITDDYVKKIIEENKEKLERITDSEIILNMKVKEWKKEKSWEIANHKIKVYVI